MQGASGLRLLRLLLLRLRRGAARRLLLLAQGSGWEARLVLLRRQRRGGRAGLAVRARRRRHCQEDDGIAEEDEGDEGAHQRLRGEGRLAVRHWKDQAGTKLPKT